MTFESIKELIASTPKEKLQNIILSLLLKQVNLVSALKDVMHTGSSLTNERISQFTS
jgi:hypothetical protein